MPHVHVVGAELEKIAQEIVALFKKEQPEEAGKWQREVRLRRQWAKEGHKMWDSGEGMPAYSIPSWVYYTYSRVLGTNDWFPHDKVAMEALLRAIPEARLVDTSAQCDADRR